MGAGGSRNLANFRWPPVPPPSGPPLSQSLVNLSIVGANACEKCDVGVDTSVTTSSVKMTRSVGGISAEECAMFFNDRVRVSQKTLSFETFFAKFQAGGYSQDLGNGFCVRRRFSDEDAATIKNEGQFNSELGKAVSGQTRPKSTTGGFSSGTKARITFSLPIKATYVSDVVTEAGTRQELRRTPKLAIVTVPTPATRVPVYKQMSITTATLYHPSPLRIENVQHDAVFSLNDPGDKETDTVILIPLKSGNTGEGSETFFSRFVPQVAGLTVPNTTGDYSEFDIPTGNEWNIKQLFWLENTEVAGIAKISNGFYTWTIKDEGRDIRYFMLDTPVNISASDLSLLTSSLPPTPPGDAIHRIVEPGTTWQGSVGPAPLYKKATGKAASVGCGAVRERMTNQAPDVFSSESIGKLRATGKGLNTCDPFAMNASKSKDTTLAARRFITLLFNIMLILAVLLGAWIAFYIVTLDYDYKYQNFADDAGIVIGTLLKQFTDKSSNAMGGLGALRDLAKGGPAGLLKGSLAKVAPDLTGSATEATAALGATAAGVTRSATDATAAVGATAAGVASSATEATAAARDAAATGKNLFANASGLLGKFKRK